MAVKNYEKYHKQLTTEEQWVKTFKEKYRNLRDVVREQQELIARQDAIIVEQTKIIFNNRKNIEKKKLMLDNISKEFERIYGAKSKGANEVAYRKHRKDFCEACGVSGEGLLCVHHMDRNHFNNDPANLKTLCFNCHRTVHVGAGQ